MATNAVPKGTLVRPTPDFYIDKLGMAAAAFEQSGSGAPDTTFDLFNNATDGSNLHVYKIWTFNDGQGMYAFAPFNGHGANFVTNGSPIITGDPAPWGQIYQDSATPVMTGFIVIPNAAPLGGYFLGGDEGAVQAHFGVGAPLAVITPGWSLRAQSLISTSEINHGLVVTFYYAVLPYRR